MRFFLFKKKCKNLGPPVMKKQRRINQHWFWVGIFFEKQQRNLLSTTCSTKVLQKQLLSTFKNLSLNKIYPLTKYSEQQRRLFKKEAAFQNNFLVTPVG
jgi:hypothetical protein